MEVEGKEGRVSCSKDAPIIERMLEDLSLRMLQSRSDRWNCVCGSCAMRKRFADCGQSIEVL